MDIYEHILANGDVPVDRTYICDVETTQRAPLPLFSADPFYEGNETIVTGLSRLSGIMRMPETGGTPERIKYLNNLSKDGLVLLVGHNFKFDLHYLRREGLNIENIVIFDTQIATYLLSGMNVIMPSLDTACAYMGKIMNLPPPPVKESYVSDMIKEGRIEEVSYEALCEYLQGDLNSTRWLYNTIQQYLYKYHWQKGLINIQMRAALAVEDMEYNGLPVDRDPLKPMRIEAMEKREALATKMEALLPNLLQQIGPDVPTGTPYFAPGTVSLDSNHTLNVLMNGVGKITVKTKQDVGKKRLKTIKKEYEQWPNLYRGQEGVAESFDEDSLAIRIIAGSERNTEDQQAYLECVSDYRAASKLLSTFIEPYEAIMASYDKDILHPTINQSVTATGRTSCSKPNAQQIPEAIRKIFTQQGREVISADYSQLELCALAHRVGPGKLRDDIRRGVDIHTVIGTQVHGRVLTKAERTRIKNVVFGYFYGGGYKKLAAESGLSIAIVKRVIRTLTDMYPEIEAYYELVTNNLQFTHLTWEGSIALRNYIYEDTQTSRRYRMVDTIREDWKTKTKGASAPFNTPRNYPIQGLATGDWVPAWTALLITYQRWYDKQHRMDGYKQVLVVHDESVGTCRQGDGERIGKVIAEIGENLLPKLYERWTKVPIAVPLRVNLKVGATW